MSLPFHFLLLSTLPLMAGTVMITSVPDTEHGLDPLTSLAGVPLTAGTQVQVGMFAGLSDDQILDLAAQGGYAQISGAFTPFATCPLPPPENRLDLAITAGEKAYGN